MASRASASERVEPARGKLKGPCQRRKAPIDLVITDIYMPTCDGLDVIRRLRRVHRELLILAISGGSGTMDYLRVAQSEGASRVLYKPFTSGIVLKTVAELLVGCEHAPSKARLPRL